MTEEDSGRNRKTEMNGKTYRSFRVNGWTQLKDDDVTRRRDIRDVVWYTMRVIKAVAAA